MHTDRVSQDMHQAAYGLNISIPSSRRDASGSRASGSGSAAGHWKHEQPIPIQVPSNSRPPATSKAGGFNPWAGHRMADNLGNKPGNNTASKTLLGPGFGPSTRGSRRPQARPQTNYAIKNKDAFQEPVDVDGDEEDIGEPVARKQRTASPDPIGSWTDDETKSPSRHSSSTSTSSTRNPLNLVPLQQHQRSLPRDGVATQRLQRAQVNRARRASTPEIIELDDDEPSDSGAATAQAGPSRLSENRTAEAPPPARRRSPPAKERHPTPTLERLQHHGKGKVNEMVRNFESTQETDPKEIIRRVDDERKAAAAHPPPQPKMLDLTAMSTNPPLGMKGRMRPKGAPLQPDLQVQSSGLHSGSATKTPAKARSQTAKAPPSRISLPLQAWVYGNRTYDDDEDTYWFVFDGEIIEIKPFPESTKPYAVIPLRDGVKSVTYTRIAEGNHPVVIKIETSRTGRKVKTLQLQSDEAHFQYGAHGRTGTLAFRFDRSHTNWWEGGPYQDICNQIKKACKNVSLAIGNAAEQVWGTAIFDGKSDDADEEDARRGFKSIGDGAGPSRSRQLLRADDGDDGQMRLSSYVRPRAPADRDVSSISQAPARALRSSARRAEQSTRNSPVLDPDELVLVYPPSGAGAINITRGDLKRLEPGQYLNDTLIEFGLKLWHNNLREENPELADQIHVFSSFFYKKLNVKDKQTGYQSVRKWTSKFDLFQKKYIIVPINEHLHWYLAIICNPEYTLQSPPPTPQKNGPSVLTRKRKREEDAEPVDIPDGDETSQVPAARTRDTTPARSRTGDEAEENSVEELLNLNDCAISPPGEPQDPSMPSKGSCDMLQYPMSDPPMDVDGLSTQDVVEIDSAAATKGSTLQDLSVDEDDKPASVVEEEIVEIDTAPMEVDKAHASSTAVPVTRFYGSAVRKGKERALSPAVPHPSDPVSQDVEVDVEVEVEAEKEDAAEPELPDTNPDKTWIFTFDSLGSKHPAAANNLALYLQLEAQDKKGLDPVNTTPPGKKTALVPAQPNFCDCGVYLIHFVRAFMKEPQKATEIILNKKPKDYSSKEREQDWDAEAVMNYRNELLATAESLSDLWKQEKAVREEQKRKEAEAAPSGATSEAAAEESDDEIIVGEIITKPKPVNNRAKGKAKAAAASSASAPAQETKADRLR
ncbi:hypothetical protein PsYK624_044520 [Phanerochaete sordida]|uniref:Ubiquitin-like protease family profile domain-containing protein n=1 Tax=Phanerochaete sordida TaxID=48140 RepID=A0A9P3G6G4_9APHY|nr:hypothetical protein PsYK624_044520 [Phanerochaete sordida]